MHLSHRAALLAAEREYRRRLRLTALAAVVLLVLLFGAAVAFAQSERAYMLAVGSVTTTDTERTECYFQIGQGAMLALHPKGEPCVMARDLVGRTGRLVFMLDPVR